MRDRRHIPTALSIAETRELGIFARHMRMVECGALLGYSTLVMAETASHVVSIDRHEGYGPSTLHAFLSNIEGCHDRITPVVADCRALLPMLTCDRYFIDLDGTYETTRAVLEAIPYRNIPIALHDFERNNCPGVIQAVLDTPGYEIDRVVDTLAFIRRR